MDDRTRKAIGLLGEELALKHLKEHGLKIVARNYRCKMGELDLVMLDGGTLVLVEVRCRSRNDYGGAAASIDWRKQRRLILAAEHLRMKRADLRSLPARFDVVAITAGAGEAKLHWIKDVVVCLMLETTAETTCPHCGEAITLFLDLSVESQEYIEDCSVCCQPMIVQYHADGGELTDLRVESAN